MGATPVTPHSTPEARALLNFIHAMYGKKTLSGQMWAPWGIDEIQTVKEITGKLPAIRGQDYIHDKDNKRENELAIDWWRAGGIPTIMWHWGAPSKGEGYNQSKMTIDIDRCFEEGTEEHTAMWRDLKRIADHLTELRDANVPVLWRPVHECGTMVCGGWSGVPRLFPESRRPDLQALLKGFRVEGLNEHPTSNGQHPTSPLCPAASTNSSGRSGSNPPSYQWSSTGGSSSRAGKW